MAVSIFSMTFSGSGFVLVNVASNECCGWNVEPLFGDREKKLLNFGGDGGLKLPLNVGGGVGGGGGRLNC